MKSLATCLILAAVLVTGDAAVARDAEGWVLTPRDAEVTAATPQGGVVRFEGDIMGGAVGAAQDYCFARGMDAVPLGFFQLGKDVFGRDRLMTFQCDGLCRSGRVK